MNSESIPHDSVFQKDHHGCFLLNTANCCQNICISHGFSGEAGFGDEWEKTHFSWKTMWNAFSPMLSCVAKMLPIIMRRCICMYWCQSGEMEISPTCSYHWQHCGAWANSSFSASIFHDFLIIRDYLEPTHISLLILCQLRSFILLYQLSLLEVINAYQSLSNVC